MKLTTRRKKERKMLELMKRAADQSSDGIVITNAKLDDSHSKIVYTNKTFCHMTGYSPSELIGKSLLLLHGSKTDPKVLTHRREKLSAGEEFHGKIVKYRKDGSEFYNECDVAPVYNSENKITNYMYIMRDITKQVSMEENKVELVSVVSNEIKTPLTAIKGFVEILKKSIREQKYDKAGEYLTIIDSETDRVLELTRALLETNRIEALGFEPEKQLSNLDDVIRQVIKNVKITALSHKIKRRGKIKEEVNCDKDRIGLVITNLLTNAIKYSPDAKEVYVLVKKEHNSVTISVQDFGIGIPPEKQELIFDRYYRSSDSGNSKSSGLGLYIAAEIVRNHNGKIWVESSVGKGSVFSFSIPLTEIVDSPNLKIPELKTVTGNHLKSDSESINGVSIL